MSAASERPSLMVAVAAAEDLTPRESTIAARSLPPTAVLVPGDNGGGSHGRPVRQRHMPPRTRAAVRALNVSAHGSTCRFARASPTPDDHHARPWPAEVSPTAVAPGHSSPGANIAQAPGRLRHSSSITTAQRDGRAAAWKG